MTESYETYIKQETISLEQELLTLLPPSNDETTSSTIPFKKESIFDDQSTLITVKNEPISDDILSVTAAPVTVRNESSLTNLENPMINGFIIYELESYEKNGSTPFNASINSTPTLQAASATSSSRLSCVPTRKLACVLNPPTTRPAPALLMGTTTLKSASPPILLNGQFRKRSKVVGVTSIPNNNIVLKKACYNLEDVKMPQKIIERADATETPRSRENPKVGAKKIINYLMQKKIRYIPGTEGLRGKQETPLKRKTECRVEKAAHPQQISAIENSISPSTEQNVLPSTTTTPTSEKATEIVIKTEIVEDDAIESYPVNDPVRNTSSETEKSITITTASSSYTGPTASSTRTSSYANENVQTENKTFPTLTSELKVKCLCQLSGKDIDQESTSSTNEELRDFFKNMFQETRRLRKQQQRAVKMHLLQSICESEEMVDRGKCCCF